MRRPVLIRLLLLMMIAVITAGCAQTRYAWNGYDDKLYTYYKNPVEADRFMESLHEIILDGESSGRVPPGIYAEYGYQLYERGRYPEAVAWFTKERTAWPDSRILMDRMIALASGKAAKQPGHGIVKQSPPEAGASGVKQP